MTTSQLRSHRRVRSLVTGLVFVIALLSPLVAMAPAARADAIDSAFLQAIKAKGINFTTPQAAVVAGHEVCDELDLGRQKTDIASDVKSFSNLDDYRAGFFVGASVAAYCPRYRTPPGS